MIKLILKNVPFIDVKKKKNMLLSDVNIMIGKRESETHPRHVSSGYAQNIY